MRPYRFDLVDTIDTDTSSSVLRGIRAGADWSFAFVLKTDPSTPENLTGKTFVFHVRKSRDDATVLLSGSTGAEIMTGGSSGTVTISFPKAKTAGLVSAQNFYGFVETTSGWVPRLEGLIDVVKAPAR